MKIKSFTQNLVPSMFIGSEAKPKNEVLFVRIKLLYVELSPFQIHPFMVQLVSNTQYSKSGDLIYLENTYFYCIPYK